MKKRIRRIISLLLSVIILLSMLPGAALGAEVEGAADEAAENTGITETEEESADIGTEQEDVPTEEENEPSEDEPTEEDGEPSEDGTTEEESEPSEDELTEDTDEPAADENDSLETQEETTAEEPEASDAEAIAEDGTDQTITYDLTLEYDDRWSLSDYLSEDLTGYTISGIQTNTVTSYQVSGGKKTKTRDTSVVTANGTSGLIASGVGTATVTLPNSKTGDQATLSVTVEPATLTVMLVAGQSNAEGKSSSSTGTHPEDSVLCEEGQVYSTYAPSTTSNAKKITGISSLKACTESTASAFVAASLTSSVSLAGSKLVYPLNALTESGKGKSGPDSGLAYQWNALTGDKVWVVNAAYSGSSITTWVPGGTNYERALAVFQYAQTTATAEIAAGHYTQGKTLLFWLQGEADASMSASNYLSYFSKMKKGFTSEGLGIKYYGLIMVRASNGHVTSDDLIMTGPRLAQYLMGNSTSYSNVYVVSNVNEQWVTDSGVKSYFRSIYGSELTYPLRKKSTLSGLPTSVSEVHSDIHYSQVAHNENGLTAAQTMYDIVYGSSSSSISVQWYGPSGTALSSGTAVTLAMGSTYSYVPVVTPLSQSKKVSISYSTSSFSYSSSTGQLTASASGTATLTAKVGKVSAALKVTVNNTPQLTSVSASNSGITIAWNKVTGAAKYRVFRKTGSSGSWTKLGDTKSTSYRDTTAKSGTTYYYTVRCINSSGTKYTSGYDKTGLSIKAAAKPTLSSVSANSSGVTVTWKAATGAVKYRVYRKVSGGSWSKIAVTTSTSYTDTTAAVGTTYYYSVRCVNAADSQFTSGYNTTGLSITRAATPTLSSVYANNNGVCVKWTAATGAVKYRVYRKTSGSSWTRVGVTTSTSYTDTTAKAGTTYYYTDRCVNSANNQFTSGYNTTGLSIKAAATPAISSVTASNSGVTVTWKVATGAEKYRVYRKTASGSWVKIAVTTSTSYTDTTAKAGTTYYYTVRCVNSANNQFTSGYNATGLSIKPATTPVLSSVTAFNGGVMVKWQAATGVAKYRVYRKTSGSAWMRMGDTTSTSYTDTTAAAGTTYYYTVRCVNAAGSQFTSGYNTAGLSITVAATPALSGVTVSEGGVTVTWTAATGAAKYRVYRRTSDSSWTKVGVTTSTSYTDTTAKAGTTYYYTVRCVNSANNQFTSGYNTTGLTAEVK